MHARILYSRNQLWGQVCAQSNPWLSPTLQPGPGEQKQRVTSRRAAFGAAKAQLNIYLSCVMFCRHKAKHWLCGFRAESPHTNHAPRAPVALPAPKKHNQVVVMGSRSHPGTCQTLLEENLLAKGKDALSKGAHVPLAELSKWAQAAPHPRTQFLPVLTPRWENGAGRSAGGLRQPENLSINRQPKMQNKILHIRATLRLDGAQNQRARVSHTHTHSPHPAR